MKAILIDAKNQEVKEIEIDGSLESMYEALGCGTITQGFRLPFGDICWVDDDGLLNDPQYFFVCDAGYQPYAGNGLILGGRGENNSDCRVSVDTLKNLVEFYTLAQVQELIRQGQVDYDVKFTCNGKTEILTKIDLGAFTND